MQHTTTAAAAILASVLAGCAAMPKTELQGEDAMSLTLSGTWRSDLIRYQQETSAVARKRPSDTGIRSLAYVVRSIRKEAECSFRELRYLPGEAGYAWDEQP